MSENYNSSNIQVLSDLDHIRLNYGMYIGDSENPHHLLQEAIDNAIDEVTNGYSNGITVKINKTANDDMIYTVIDYGRGIPTGYKEVNGKQVSILEAITTKSNSGGKFDGKAYLSSAGLHGLGMTIINALSDQLEIVSTNDHIRGTLLTVKGEPVNPSEYTVIPNSKSGTSIQFRINKNNPYFDNNQVPFDYIVDKLNTYQAFGVKNIKLILNDEDITEKYITKFNPFDLHKHPMDNGTDAITVDSQVTNEAGEKFRLSFNYISGSSTSYKFNGYTNYLYNKDGGGHILAAQDALIKAFDMFCTARNITKPSTMASDYFIGLNAIVHCNIIKKSFASQTKDKLTTGTGSTRDYFNELVELTAKSIYEQFEKHVGVTKAIIQRIADYRKERENRKELKGLSQYITINQSEGSTVRRYSAYEKLTECSSKNRDECELIITEGDSASGAIQRKRNKLTTAVLPLKGRILNISKVTVTQALKNKEIAGIISSVGTGILDKCDINRRRYANIYYCFDPDCDGKMIVNLVVSLFVNFMPDIVKAGCLRLIVPPYYMYEDSKGEWQGVDSFEKIPEYAIKKHKYERIKGLGSMTDEETEKFLLSDKRKIIVVNYPSDIDEFNRIMSSSEGKRDLLEGLGVLL